MATEENGKEENIDYNQPYEDGSFRVKLICLGDSAVGKSKLVERYILDGFKQHQLSTYALTMYRHKTIINDEQVVVDIWDTAASDGTNVVNLFTDAISKAVAYKKNPTDFTDEVMQELEAFQITDDDF